MFNDLRSITMKTTENCVSAIEKRKMIKMKKPKSSYRNFWKATIISASLIMAELLTPRYYF